MYDDCHMTAETRMAANWIDISSAIVQIRREGLMPQIQIIPWSLRNSTALVLSLIPIFS